MRSRFANIKDEYYSVGYARDLRYMGVEIKSLVFLNHKESEEIIVKIEELLNLVKNAGLGQNEMVLFIAIIIGILGTCHIYPDGNGRTLLVLAKVLISNLTDLELNLEEIHKKNSQFNRIMAECSLSNLPEGLHPNDLIENLVVNYRRTEISYLDLIENKLDFFENYALNLSRKLVILKAMVTNPDKNYRSKFAQCLPEYQELYRLFEENSDNKNWVLSTLSTITSFLNRKIF